MTLPWRLITRLSIFITHYVLFCIAVFFILLIITQTLSRHFMAVFPFVVGENVVLEEFDGICLIDFIKGFLFPLYEVPGRITCLFLSGSGDLLFRPDIFKQFALKVIFGQLCSHTFRKGLQNHERLCKKLCDKMFFSPFDWLPL